MTQQPLPWFPCEPGKLLGALAGMPPDQQLVYFVVLLRIYEDGRACGDSIDALSRRTGLNRRRVADALDLCFKAARLVRDGDGMMNPKAAEILAARAATRRELSEAGARGAARKYGKTQTSQTPEAGHPSPGPVASASDLQLELDSPPNGGVRTEDFSTPAPKAKSKPRSQLPSDWDLPADGFRYAEDNGFRGQMVRTMAEAFKNHHRARGNLMADWAAAWRTWVQNEKKFSANRRGPPPRGPSLVDIARGPEPRPPYTNGAEAPVNGEPDGQ